MAAALYNLEIRSGRRLHERFGLGPENDPIDLTGTTWTGGITDSTGAVVLLLAPYLTVSVDGIWVDLDVPADVVDDNIASSGNHEIVGDLGAGPETWFTGETVYVVSLVP